MCGWCWTDVCEPLLQRKEKAGDAWRKKSLHMYLKDFKSTKFTFSGAIFVLDRMGGLSNPSSSNFVSKNKKFAYFDGNRNAPI